MVNPIQYFDFLYKNRTFKCQLFSKQTTKKKTTVTLSITPNQIIQIKAPLQTPHKLILETLQNFGEWIYSHPAYQTPSLRYIDSEKHLYLGQLYPLKIKEQFTSKQTIQLVNNHIQITVRKNTPLRIYSLLNNWYKFQALQIFPKQLALFESQINWIDWKNRPLLLRIKKMKSQWGSYNRKENGIITLNQHLIKAPLSIIDYVIAHELCHAVEFNHSKQFYKLVDKLMVDWRQRQNYLHQHHYLLGKDQKPNTI